MANLCSCHLRSVLLLGVITVFLHLPQFTSGLYSPTNVKAQVANNGRYLIISWDYQAAANYSTVHVRTYITKPYISANFTTITGPTKLPCNSSSCSFCVFNTNYNASCSTFNPVYKISVGIELEFDLLISYRVGACSKNDSTSCVNSAWKNLNVPSPGEFSGYILHKKMCLDHDDVISIENNKSVEFCVEKCTKDTSCKSFEYGHGYSSKGVFQDDLFFKELGQCKLRPENTGSHKLKSCAYSYYEKTTSPGSTVANVPLALLLSLSVVISATI